MTVLVCGMMAPRALGQQSHQNQKGQQFDVWTGPSPILSRVFSMPLVGLSFAKPLTFGQVRQAAEGLDLRARGIYFALPRQGGGGGSQPEGVPVENALAHIRSSLADTAYSALRASEVPEYFERTVGKVRSDQSKRV